MSRRVSFIALRLSNSMSLVFPQRVQTPAVLTIVHRSHTHFIIAPDWLCNACLERCLGFYELVLVSCSSALPFRLICSSRMAFPTHI